MTRFGKFLFNGIILTCASIFMRGISVAFNVYISNKIGAQGMGLFTLISTVYGFAVTLATSGINFATVNLISASLGNSKNHRENSHPYKNKEIKRILGRCVRYALTFSIFSGILLFSFSNYIGVALLRDERTVSSLRLLSFTLPPIALSSVLSGYFTSMRRVYKNAAIQLVGQFTKIYIVILLFGAMWANDTEGACLAIVIGGAISEFISFLIQWILYLYEKAQTDDFSDKICEKRNISSQLRKIALPIAFSAYIRSGLITIEHILIPIGLEKSGANKASALAAYGTLHSMVFPLVLFPSAILSAFAGLLVPEVAESRAATETLRIDRIISRVMRSAIIFSIGAAGIIGCFSYELGSALYPDSEAGVYIRMIAPLIPIMYIDSSVDAILKGLGQQVYSMFVNIIDALMSVILVVFLLPKYGIFGYIITVYFTETLNATLSITRLLTLNDINVKPKVFRWLIMPLFSIIISTSLTKLLFSHSRFFILNEVITLASYIVFSTVLYIIFLIMTRTVKSSQIRNYIKYIKYGFQKSKG